MADYRRAAKRAWTAPRLREHALKQLPALRRCLPAAAHRRALKYTRGLRAARRRRALRSMTPYHCGSHGWFAIPCYIVACESRFDPWASNASGAYGYYQLMPTWLPHGASIERQHAAAARLWNGGRGAGNWVCA